MNLLTISSIPMGGASMSGSDAIKLPEVMVFAGPNGSGKTTITKMAKTVGEYINNVENVEISAFLFLK